jgi:hypothetical protein
MAASTRPDEAPEQLCDGQRATARRLQAVAALGFRGGARRARAARVSGEEPGGCGGGLNRVGRTSWRAGHA